MKINSINSFEVFKSRQNKRKNKAHQQQEISAPTKYTQKTSSNNPLSVLDANAIIAANAQIKNSDPTMKHIQELYSFYEKANKAIEPLISGVQERMDDTAQSAQDLYDEVMNVYEGYLNGNNNPLVRVVPCPNRVTIMEELDDTRKVKRRTTFHSPSQDKLIEENPENLPDGTKKIGKRLQVDRNEDKDELYLYIEDYTVRPSGRFTYTKGLNFAIKHYKENKRTVPDKPTKVNITYETIDGKLSTYKEFDKQNEPTREIIFYQNKPRQYSETKKVDSYKPSIIKTVDYMPSLIDSSYSEGEISVSMQSEDKTQDLRELILKDGKPSRYIEGYYSYYSFIKTKEYQMTENGWQKVE